MTFIWFVLVLSVTIFVHELGHFIFAKRAGIYVYEFCLGMGPRIFKFKRKNDETEYGLRLFPIGGFCSMAGESVEEDEDIPKDKLLQNKTWMQRFLTVIAGVMFNFLFAIILLVIIGWVNGNVNNKPIVNNIKENSPSYEAGLKINDRIVKLNGAKIHNIDKLMLEYQLNYGKPLKIEVKRNDEYINLEINPKEETKDGNKIYSYGFSLDNTVKNGFFEGIKFGFNKFGSLMEQMALTIGYLFTGKLSLSNLSGPVGIYNVVGQSAQAGFLNIVYLVAFLCINVGFINLLPIPAFDGCRALFLIIEKIRKKPINPKTENMVHMIGLVILMVLMIIITFNDISRFIIK